MKILHTPSLVPDLKNCDIFLDTNALIGFFNKSDFRELFSKTSCGLITIPSVVFEFTRGSQDIDTFNLRTKFIDEICTVYQIEKHLDEFHELIVVLQRLRGSISYTDFLLSACLYKFPGALLLTENHRHFPTEILDRKYLITLETDSEIRNYGLYKISLTKFNKAGDNILKRKLLLNKEKDDIPF